VAAAQAAVEAAKIGVQSAQAKLEDLRAQPKPADLAAAQAAVDTARANLQSAQAKLDQLLAGPQPEDVAAAEAAVRQAEEQLRLQAQPYTEYDLEAQRQAVRQAEAQLALKRQPASPQAIEEQRQAVAQAQAQAALRSQPYTDQDVAAAVAAVEQARAQVAQAQYALDNATLVAPFDGVVNAVAMNPGEQASANSTITLVNPDALRVDINVDETDIARVEIGQPVLLTLDALPGRPVRARVTAIAPQATTQQGVTSYLVSATLENGAGVLPGMTATANIIYAQKADALQVPNRAIRRQGRDQVVDVLTPEGKLETRVVRRGIGNDQMSEILEGLAEGEQVVIPSTQTRAPSASGIPGAPLPGGFGGPPIRR
ncbi:MAG TPA: efflux RND transporter periplasmic adaptor subunit, partial [Chloroflexota bacterium]|nr:efflux RND transporter periplasmic adaptor subunit [Chloroflexota bacterium]